MKTLTVGMLIGLSVLFGCASRGSEQPVEGSGVAAPADNKADNKVSLEPAVRPNTQPAPVARADSPPAAPIAPKTVQAPSGTEISVILVDSLSSAKNKAGDQFTATLAAPLVINGQTVMDRGTKIQGKVVDAEGSGRVKGVASMRLILTSLTTGGKTIPIVTQTLATEAEATKGRDAAVVGGGAGIGAAIGAIAGGKGGAGKGAVIGSAAGAGAVLATKGKEVEFPSESNLKFRLAEPVTLPRS